MDTGICVRIRLRIRLRSRNQTVRIIVYVPQRHLPEQQQVINHERMRRGSLRAFHLQGREAEHTTGASWRACSAPAP